MYWKQVVVGLFAAGATSWWLVNTGEQLAIALGAGTMAYVGFRLLVATYHRTRYWLKRGGGHGSTPTCPNCERTARRLSDDWIATCHRCGWTAGIPILRWLTRSVPAQQFRRSLSLSRVGAFVVAFVLIATTPALTPAALSVSDTVENVANSTEDIAPTDTDGDGLLDSTEQAGETEGGHTLPGANHTRKDLYLTVYVGAGVEPLTDEEQADLREIWASMPVENPNGTSGIDLHITQFELSDSVTTDLSQSSLDYLNERVYERRVPVNAQCSVYAVALGEVTIETELAGRAFSPGYFAVVDGSETKTYDTQYTIRTVTITHELLHNIVGEFDDGTIHTSEGWLSAGHETHGTQFYMADKTARRLSADGFADSEFFEEEVC